MNFEIIFNAIIIVATVIGLAVKYVAPLITAKVNRMDWDKLQELIQAAVSAAEQLYKAPGDGKRKLAYVKELLEGAGWDCESQELRAYIEAAVFALKGGTSHGG